MRILMVSEDLPAPQVGGLGKHVVTLSNALIAHGHEVVLMGRDDLDYDACKAEVGFLGDFIPGFNFKGGGWKETQIGAWLPYKRPMLAKRIARAIERHAGRFDVVHYHGHLPMVGMYVPQEVNFVQTRHDQGSECITHLRFRSDAVCTTKDPADCAGCIAESPGQIRRGISTLAVGEYRRATERTFASCKTIFVSEFLRRQFLRIDRTPNLTVAGSSITLSILRRLTVWILAALLQSLITYCWSDASIGRKDLVVFSIQFSRRNRCRPLW